MIDYVVLRKDPNSTGFLCVWRGKKLECLHIANDLLKNNVCNYQDLLIAKRVNLIPGKVVSVEYEEEHN